MKLRRAQVFLSATDGSNDAGTSGLSGATALTRQPALEGRVTPQEAETLPLAELKDRLRAEARADEEVANTRDASAGGLTLDTDTNADAADVSGVESAEVGTKDASAAPSEAGKPEVQPTDIEKLQQQLGSMSANLKTLSDERKQLLAQVQGLRAQQQQAAQASEAQQVQAQHQKVEAHIATLPEAQQPVARQHYMNQLGQAALNDYQRFLSQQQAQIHDAELRLAVQQAPGILKEIAGFVAQQHEISPDVLEAVIASEQMQRLLSAPNTREGYVAAMSTAGEWLDFYANQEAGRAAAEKATRRQEAAQNPPQRDTPNGGAGAGGDTNMAARIESMSRDEFFKWKAAQLKRAQEQGNIRYA